MPRPLVAQERVLGFEPLAPPQGAAKLHLRSDDGEQPFVVPGLLHEVTGAAAHRFDGHVHRAPGGHHDDRHGGIDRPQPAEQREAFLSRCRIARVVQVDQRDVEIACFDRAQHARRRRRRLDLTPFAFEQQAKRLEDIGLVVGHEHAGPLEDIGGGRLRPRRLGGHQSFTSHPSRSRTIRLPYAAFASECVT